MTARERELEVLLVKKDLQIALLKEELYLARHRIFGRKTEAAIVRNLPLFDELPLGIVEKPTDLQETKVTAHVRKQKAGRKPLSADLPRTDIIHDIPESEKQCACGCTLTKIGEEVSEKLGYIPEQVFVERHIRPKYACKACEGSGDEDKPAVRLAPVPPSIIPRSITSPSLLATIIIHKFVDHLPFYRQEVMFERLNIEVSRQDMSNWAIKVGLAVENLVNMLERTLLSSSFIQMDETTLQVLGEPARNNTSKSYMWLARGGPPGKQVILYRYHETRSAKHPAHFLADFKGHLQADGYEAYGSATEGRNIVLVGCWAHARRKFDEASKASKEPRLALEALEKIRKLYVVEKELRSLLNAKSISADDFMMQRQQVVEPLLAALHEWLMEQSAKVLPSSLVGKAIGYSLNQWEKLIRYLDRPEITPDNNACENAIRPFVLGRKNWLFSGSPLGARTSCNLYTLIETAKANGLKPWDYMNRICTELPITSPEYLHTLLPFA